jgi:hypothetical protein
MCPAVAIIELPRELPRVRWPRTVHPDVELLYDQLEWLALHATKHANKRCSECRRYLRVRSALLEIFDEPKRRKHVLSKRPANAPPGDDEPTLQHEN